MAIPLIFSLTSASSANFVTINSKIKHSDIQCKKQLIGYSTKTITTLSNIKKNPVASLSFNYELYQMYKPTEVQIPYHPGFILLYQADIHVNNAVEYKGGFCNWLDGKHAGFLNYINIKSKFEGISYTGHGYQCPSLYAGDFASDYRYLKDVDPHDQKYKNNSIEWDKQTTYNAVTTYLDKYGGDKFQDSCNLFTNSYYQSFYEMMDNDLNSIKEFDHRLLVNLQTSQKIENDKTAFFEQNFQFNNNPSMSVVNGKEEIKISHDNKGLFSGPCKNGVDEDSPFDFSFYGLFAIESTSIPDKITLDLTLDTFHGSQVSLDTFESSASASIVLFPTK